jgi:hypothetical protein
MAGRPMGVTLIAILQLLQALVGAFFAVLMVMAAMVLGPLGMIALIIGFVFLIIAIIGFILFYGLWTVKGWAWIWTLILNIITILLDVYQMNIVSIGFILSLIIVLYLLVPSTRAAFKQ